MSESAASFVGEIPEEYDRGLGPIIFADFAIDMARRVAAAGPMRVLETAAGTGIVTRLLRDLLPAEVHLTATDLNAPMLAIASGKFRPEERVEFRTADATALPFPDGAFDAVACQFGVMFFPDKDASFREARRILAPGGRYVFSVWDAHQRNSFGRIAHEVAASFFPADPPGFYAARSATITSTRSRRRYSKQASAASGSTSSLWRRKSRASRPSRERWSLATRWSSRSGCEAASRVALRRR
jgi:SAM-dependent methyltransferase